MVLLATTAAILNMAGAVSRLPAWFRVATVLFNVTFVVLGAASAEMLVWAPHLALIPLNTALLIGSLGGRSIR